MSPPPVTNISTAKARDSARLYAQMYNMGIHYVIKKNITIIYTGSCFSYLNIHALNILSS
jgi:hypothetical protein